ncbi:hypothetical protein BD410DRAFT_870927 [Rickenella mellea]|uniref:Uncharacterized protein n=1 Tax=Rickenella mellea TaxID=50990 RepID=A0A4Y7Q1Q9_9AGAM|nr:hypothetical protein BD410DRAFT_870927 [Rickenella mellea]
MSHGGGLPSLGAIKRRSHYCQIRPSVAAIKAEDIDFNIKSLFGVETNSTHCAVRGHSILIDEVSLDERARYLKFNNKIVGLCREHGRLLDLTCTDLDSMRSVATAVETGLCHFGKEATVAAIAAFSPDRYQAFPVIVSPTCKTETAVDQAKFIQLLIASWKSSAHGENKHGPIWSVASDGDATRRLACHTLFMQESLHPDNPLHETLSRLPGLNLQTGKNDVTMDSDPKHLKKRHCTLLRTPEGFLIKDSIINRSTLTKHLMRIPGMTMEKTTALLDPADHQNVPKAVRLLTAVASLRNLPTDTLNPTERKQHEALVVLGHLLDALVQPFVKVQLTLTQQVTNLSKYAHLAFILFRRHGTSFMTGQLYTDTQSMIKNAIFTIAKQQLLDCGQPLHLCQLGDDRLEQVFSETRCQTHQRNYDILELAHKLSTVVDTCHILEEYPEWDRGHRRLKLRDADGVDHVNPASWEGNVTSGEVSLSNAWLSGRRMAEDVFRQAGMDADFDAVFKISGVDMLHPNGDGKYPGIGTHAEKDRSVEDSGDKPDDDPHHVQGNDNTTAATDSDSETIADEDPTEVHFEDLLPDPGDDEQKHKDYIETTDGTFHKASLARYLFGSKNEHKSTDRKFRIRTFTREFRREEPKTIGPAAFQVGDIAGILVHSGDVVTLALLEVTAIECKGKRVTEIDHHEYHLPASDINVTGNLLCMDAPEEDNQPWLWSGEFIRIRPVPKSGQQAAAATNPTNSDSELQVTRKTLTIKSSSLFTVPLNPDITTVPPKPSLPSPLSNNNAETAESDRLHGSVTWSINGETLQLVSDTLWSISETLSAEQRTSSIPRCAHSDVFPYKTSKGKPAFISEPATAALNALKISDEDVRCYQCAKLIKRSSLRAHVGGHILHAVLNVSEPGLCEPINTPQPCGFCGKEGCTLVMQKTAKSYKVISSCARSHYFKLAIAAVSSKATPCTNVPIICTICRHEDPKAKDRTAIWKYNFTHHLRTAHPSHYPHPPNDLANKISISTEE